MPLETRCHFCIDNSPARHVLNIVYERISKIKECNSITKINNYERTVVLIHIKAPTFSPMATAPAVPPRTADLAALSRISPTVGLGLLSSAPDMIFVGVILFACLFEMKDERLP